MKLATLVLLASTAAAIAQEGTYNNCLPATGGSVYVGPTVVDTHMMTPLEKAVQICSWHESSGMIPPDAQSHYDPKWRDCYVLEKRLKDQEKRELEEKRRIADQKDWDIVHKEFMAGVKK